MNLLQELKDFLVNLGYSLEDVIAIDLKEEVYDEYFNQYFRDVMTLKKSSENKVSLIESQNDFNYYNGFGSQYVYGTVWLSDGTWLGRDSYDGAEGFEHRMIPVIPEELM